MYAYSYTYLYIAWLFELEHMALRIGAPSSGTVFTETWSLTLYGGEHLYLDAEWVSPSNAETGLYFVEAEITDAFGRCHRHRSIFTVLEQESWDISLPLLFGGSQ